MKLPQSLDFGSFWRLLSYCHGVMVLGSRVQEDLPESNFSKVVQFIFAVNRLLPFVQHNVTFC